MVNHSQKLSNFEYDYYEPFLKPDYLKTYSCKFHNIINSILGSDGIVLVYTRFITSGIVPFCLALEEHGFSRHKKSRTIPNLFNKEYSDSNIQSNNLSYGIICGNKYLSPNNKRELSFFTDDDNKDGKQMKVMIINEAGAEGLDFKNLRQVHIIDPWFNRSRLDQVIGRAIRNCSHKNLPFNKHNCCIFQHGSIFISENNQNIISQNKALLARLEKLEKIALSENKSKDLAIYRLK